MNPFDYHGADHTEANANTRRRLKIYRRFIRQNLGRSLDIGKPGYISRNLGINDEGGGDLNWVLEAPQSGYDSVTCFEVLNHVMNPLLFLCNVRRVLRPGGRLYLSVPKLWLIPWHHCRYNFVMYETGRLRKLIEYAGYTVERVETHNPWPWYFIFWGVRPFFRVLFNRITVWEVVEP